MAEEPNSTRRSVLKAAALFAATPTAAFAYDPIVDAIQAYRDGLADFNANAPMDDHGANVYAEESYLRPMNNSAGWSQPAVTKRGAIEAIRLANAELQDFDAPATVVAMVWAALAYFENEH